jgi:hypothetical protein
LRCPPPSHKGGNEEEREKPEKEPYIFEWENVHLITRNSAIHPYSINECT